MSENRPLFSLVIPTRNRGHLLRHSLQSALSQTFDDYEVVVSDNDSQDITANVIRELAHPKLRSVRTDRGLPMPDHWEFAAQHANGQYIMYLCDDDALAPHALSETERVLRKNPAQLIVLGSAFYNGMNSIVVACRNCLNVPIYDGTVKVVSSTETLRRIARFDQIGHEMPRMLNSFCHRDLFFRAREKMGNIFVYAPDYSFALASVASVPHWLHIQKPLWICGCFQESIGMNHIQSRGEATQTFCQEMNAKKLYHNTPLGLTLVNNVLATTFLECKRLCPELLREFDLDWVGYFRECWRDILVLESYGSNMANDIAQFNEVLERQPDAVKGPVKRHIRSWTMRARRILGYKIPRSRWLVRVGSRMFRNERCYWGQHHGFDNICGAANFLRTIG